MKRGNAEAILHEVRGGACGHKAMQELFAIANQGSAEACVVIALAFYHGTHSLHMNRERAEEYFKSAVLHGCEDGIAHYYLAGTEFDRDNMSNAFRHLLVTVSIGCSDPVIEKTSGIVIRQGIRLGLVNKEEYNHSLLSLQSRGKCELNEDRLLFQRQRGVASSRQPKNTLVVTFVQTRPRPMHSRLDIWAPRINRYWGLDEDDLESDSDDDDLPDLEDASDVADTD